MRYTLSFKRFDDQNRTDKYTVGMVTTSIKGVISKLTGWVREVGGMLTADMTHSHKSTRVDANGKPIYVANVLLDKDVYNDIQNGIRMFWATNVNIVTLERGEDGTLRVIPLEDLRKERAVGAMTAARRIEGAAEMIARAHSATQLPHKKIPDPNQGELEFQA